MNSTGIPSPRPSYDPAMPQRAPLRAIAIVPARNEEARIGDTLRSLLAQETPFDEVIVVDAGSTDRTAGIAAAYGVTVLRPVDDIGSKAAALNHALDYVLARPDAELVDLVLPIDADTVVARDYLTHIQKPFDDPEVAIAGGSVLTRSSHTVSERGRLIEHLTGYHAYRQVQNSFDAPLVCPALRVHYLAEFGGFPDRTVAEDLDYTWSQRMRGRRAVHVREATAYVAEPADLKFVRRQLDRRKRGYFQNLRLHWRPMQRYKPALALWVNLSLLGIVIGPLALGLPIVWLLGGNVPAQVALSAIAADLVVVGVPLVVGTVRRRLNPLSVLLSLPSFYVLKLLNLWYDLKCGLSELVLLPRELAKSLRQYERARAEGAVYLSQLQPRIAPETLTVPARAEIPPQNTTGLDLDWDVDRWREQPASVPEAPAQPEPAPLVSEFARPVVAEVAWPTPVVSEFAWPEPAVAEVPQPAAAEVAQAASPVPSGLDYELDWSVERWMEYLSEGTTAPVQPEPVVAELAPPVPPEAAEPVLPEVASLRVIPEVEVMPAPQAETPARDGVDYDLDWSVERWMEYLRDAA